MQRRRFLQFAGLLLGAFAVPAVALAKRVTKAKIDAAVAEPKANAVKPDPDGHYLCAIDHAAGDDRSALSVFRSRKDGSREVIESYSVDGRADWKDVPSYVSAIIRENYVAPGFHSFEGRMRFITTPHIKAKS